VHQVYQFYSKHKKNRLAKQRKLDLISHLQMVNPYTGLDAFCRDEYFEQIGIAKEK
jgi:hypothetical protein